LFASDAVTTARADAELLSQDQMLGVEGALTEILTSPSPSSPPLLVRLRCSHTRTAVQQLAVPDALSSARRFPLLNVGDKAPLSDALIDYVVAVSALRPWLTAAYRARQLGIKPRSVWFLSCSRALRFS
jgi:hypothetical protein